MPRPFIIVFVQRSGSTAMKFDLGQHPMIDMRAEAMGGVRLPRWPGPRDVNDRTRLGWLAHHWRPREVAAGFKFQSMQFDDLPRLAAAVHEHRAVVFRLVRRDRLRQVVAVLRDAVLRPINDGKASISDQSAPSIQAFATTPITVRSEDFERAVRSVEAQHALMEQFLSHFDEVVELAYEDYLADRLPVLTTITDAVEVPAFDVAPTSVLRKITPDELRLAVTNYDELIVEAARLGVRPAIGHATA